MWPNPMIKWIHRMKMRPITFLKAALLTTLLIFTASIYIKKSHKNKTQENEELLLVERNASPSVQQLVQQSPAGGVDGVPPAAPLADGMAAGEHSETDGEDTPPAKRSVVMVSQFRTGASLYQQSLSHHPDAIGILEPLVEYDELRYRRLSQWADVPGSLEYVTDLLNCRFRKKSCYNDGRNIFQIMKSTEDSLQCSSHSTKVSQECSNIEHISERCENTTAPIFKFIRLPVRLITTLMNSPDVNNLYVILFLRDPRAIINSVRQSANCNTDDFADPSTVCRNMLDDLTTALELQKTHPGKVHIVRYEDVAANHVPMGHAIFRAIGMQYSFSVYRHLNVFWAPNTRKKNFHFLQERATLWLQKMSMDDIRQVENVCSTFMAKAGYKMAADKNAAFYDLYEYLPIAVHLAD